MSLILFTDKINSGKSETINELAESSDNFCGFVQLKIVGNRYIKYLENKNIEQFSSSNNHDCIKIGKFLFKNEVFFKLNNLLINSTLKVFPQFFVIDEWGLLEKNNKGLSEGFKHIFDTKIYENNNYIIIIRDWLFDDFINKYNLKNDDYLKCNIQSIKFVLNNC